MSTRAVAAQSGSTPVDMENRPKSTASQLSQGSDVSQVSTQQPLLSLACTFTSPALDSKLSSQDNFSNMWTVLTKCKDVVKDGRRLENVCWRQVFMCVTLLTSCADHALLNCYIDCGIKLV